MFKIQLFNTAQFPIMLQRHCYAQNISLVGVIGDENSML